jgi:predicted dehydrogenase
LGSHQLDAAGIFIHAAHKAVNPNAKKPHPLSVVALADRPLFPPDRDVEDHVYCLIEFPTPGYDPKDPFAKQKKIGVQYSSINGNGFGGYGEIVFGTKQVMVLEEERELRFPTKTGSSSSVKVADGGGPTLDTQASGAPAAAKKESSGGAKVSRGYTEELEHWAWCIRHPDPANQPRCGPEAAMADAIIALTANMAARSGKRIDFAGKEAWFDIHSDETPEGTPPSTRGRS